MADRIKHSLNTKLHKKLPQKSACNTIYIQTETLYTVDGYLNMQQFMENECKIKRK